ncbi:hypothetical protein Tco_1492078 [Tanacetum coccineum]
MWPVINNVDELNEDECFDPGGGGINVEVDDSFTFVIQTFLPYITYLEVSPLLSPTENKDTIFDLGIIAFHFSSQEPGTGSVKGLWNLALSLVFIPKEKMNSGIGECGSKLCDSVTKNKALHGRHTMLILLSSFFYCDVRRLVLFRFLLFVLVIVCRINPKFSEDSHVWCFVPVHSIFLDFACH